MVPDVIMAGKTFESVDEMMAWMDDDYNKRNKFHKLDIKYFFIRKWRNRFRPVDSVRHQYQRVTRGYSDADVWNFDYYLSEVIQGGCQWLREKGIGHPSNMTEQEWASILSQIEKGMKLSRKFDLGRTVEENLEIQKAWQLVAQHHEDLWD